MDIILKDFIINAFHENGRLGYVLSSYNQIVAVSTDIQGLLLNHIYIHQELLKELDMQSVIDIYFHDHDVVKFRFV